MYLASGIYIYFVQVLYKKNKEIESGVFSIYEFNR